MPQLTLPSPVVVQRSQRLVATSRLTAAGAVLFFLCFLLYTRHNRFPSYYHRDEPSKAEQIISDTRNFNHPQLMLAGTEIATKCLGTPMRQQPVVEVGRMVSAIFAALAVVALALTGHRAAGWAGFGLVGLCAGLCPALLVNAHTMKEETGLVFGLSLTLLASKLFWDATGPLRRVQSLLFLGVCCGLAVSGKYTGIYALLAVLPLVLLTPPLRWYSPSLRAAALLAGFILTVLVVNHRILDDFSAFKSSLQRECRAGLHGHGGQSLPSPNAFHAISLWRQTPAHILVLGVAYLAVIAATARHRGFWDFFAALFTLGYLVMLCWCAIDIYRYVLTVVLLLHFLAAMAVLRLSESLGRRFAANIVLPSAFAVLVLAVQLPHCLDYLAQFKHDSRAGLRQWVAANLPAGTVLVQDPSVGLQGPGVRHRLGIMQTSMTAAEAGELPSLRGQGVSYVAVDNSDYGRYFDPPTIRSADYRHVYAWRRQWYEQLFDGHELVWGGQPCRPMYGDGTMTEIRLYRLR